MKKGKIMSGRQFENKPVQLLRDGITGEHIFAAAWEAYTAHKGIPNEPANYKLSLLLEKSGLPVTQRAATVAASVICYLGCRRGADLLANAEGLCNSTGNKDLAYHNAWIQHNARKHGTNSGLRTLEIMLAPPGTAPSPVSISAADFEVAEQVMVWLGSSIGQKFLAACEAEIKRQERAAEFQRHLEVNLYLSPTAVAATMRLAADYNTVPVQFVT